MERGTGMALWRQIEHALISDMDDGIYYPGDRLPTEWELAERFDVNRHTVRRAMSSLADSGRVKVIQGRGTFVAENVVTYPLGERVRFTQSVEKENRLPGRRILRTETVRCEEKVAGYLGISKGDEVVVIERISLVDDRPVIYSTSYFPAMRFPNMAEAVRQVETTTEAFSIAGISDYRRKWTRITADLPMADEARYLEIPQNRPVLRTYKLDVDTEGHPIEYGITVLAADRMELQVGAED